MTKRRPPDFSDGLSLSQETFNGKWEVIAELHRTAIRKRLGEIEEERRTGTVVSTIAALFSKREEEDDAAEEKVRAVEAQIPDALPVQLERGDSRVAMSVLAALKDGAKKPAQLRETLGNGHYRIAYNIR